MSSTVGELIDRASAAHESLASTAEAIEDEFLYVADLGAAWRARLANVASARGSERAAPDVETAVAAAIEEATRIEDPHRAIDWMSTLPQVVLLALGEAG